MSEPRNTIQRYGFERVFFHADDVPPSEPEPASAEQEDATSGRLRERIADFEARIARMQADHLAELARARADGFEAGLNQARAERGEALLSATDALFAGFDAVNEHFETVSRRMASEAAAVALAAAEAIAGHAINHMPARAIDEALGRILQQIARGTALVVRTNPAMRDEVAALIEAHQARAGRSLPVSVIEDEEVPVGDARIEWQAGGLDVDADARREAVVAEISGLLP